MQRNKNGSTTTVEFDSLEEFITTALVEPPANDRGSRDRDRAKWFGSKSFEEAVGMARDGWPAGAQMALDARKTVDHRVGELVSAKASQWSFDLVGDVVDIGRYLTGEPEHWLTEADGDNGRARVVKIVANTCVSAAVQPEVMCQRGAAILAAIDAIEASGTRCEVWCGYSAKKHGSYEKLDILVPVKYAGQPLDQDRLAFALVSPSFSRRLCFSVAETERYSPGATTPATIDNVEGTIYIDSICRGTPMSEKEITDEVLKICKSAGVSL